ncbi:MAG TPA: FAD-binding protein [Micromonosporaceae bacterium]|nr:FAD-binding protein [Micromonosporaceae bacterium]
MSAPYPLRIAVLLKQVPRFEELRLNAEGRLDRGAAAPELNPYCRRAVAKGIELARLTGGHCTAVSLGPPSAEDSLREAVACGADEGILVTDPVFAGSDTLATARALAAALRAMGPFDLVLCGRNSVDADTGQTPAQVAELMGLPMAAGVRHLTLDGVTLDVHCEHDDGWVRARLPLPALLSCAERLTAPAKADPAERAAVPFGRIRQLSAADLDAGPWGTAASRTTVGRTRHIPANRSSIRLSGAVDYQVAQAVATLDALGVFDPVQPEPHIPVPAAVADPGDALIAVLAEPGRGRATRELLGEAACLARIRDGHVAALTDGSLPAELAAAWGADRVVTLDPAGEMETALSAMAFASWCAGHRPWAVLAPSCMWGREIAGRMAARLDCGLVGDATELAIAEDGRLVCWKPAFSGASVVEVRCDSPVQIATIRPGVLPLRAPRIADAEVTTLSVPIRPGRRRIERVSQENDDCFEDLTTAQVVVAVGAGVPAPEYPLLRPLLDAFGGELAATRKVTDRGWQPRSRQIGITGRSISPRLLISVGARGAFTHLVGARGAGTILAINRDPAALVFAAADVGIVADWREALPQLTAAVLARNSRSTALTGGDS